MTINNAQGQSISWSLGLDLGSACFSHRQLYVALSRTTNPRNVFICTGNGSKLNKKVVHPEFLTVSSKHAKKGRSLGKTRSCASHQPETSNINRVHYETIVGKWNRLNRSVQAGLWNCSRSNFFAAMLHCIVMRWSLWYLLDHGSMTLQSLHSSVWSKTPTLRLSMHIFLTLLRRAKGQIAIQSALEFFRYHISDSSFALSTSRLPRCKIWLLPFFHGDHTGNSNHWGLASLEKMYGTIRVHDSLHNLNWFADILPDIKRLAESLTKGCKTKNCEWLETWSIRSEIFLSSGIILIIVVHLLCLTPFLSQEIFWSRG